VATSTEKQQDALPLLKSERYAGTFMSFQLWAGANVLISGFLLGGYYAAGLGLYGMLVVTVVGCLVGCLWPSLTGMRATRYGIDEFVGMRSTFGTRGSYIGILILIIINVGWIGILSQLPGNSGIMVVQSLTHKSLSSFPTSFGLNWYTLFALGCGIIGPVLMVYIKPTSVFVIVKFTVPLLLIFATVVFVKLLWTVGWTHMASIKPTHSIPFAYGIEAAVAYNISWFPYMGAWNRYAKTEKAAFWGAWSGLIVAGVIFAWIGGMAALVFGNADPAGWATKAGLGIPAMFIIIFSTLINNAMLLYCSVMAVKVTFPKLNYHLIVIVCAAPSIAVAFQGTLIEKFNAILSMVAALEGPYWGVALGDYFLVRRQKISVPDLYARRGKYWFTRGWNLGAILIWVIGIVMWLLIAGWTTTIGFLQHMTPGWGKSLYSIVTATSPIILICAALYYFVGYRLGFALRSKGRGEEAAQASAVPAAVASIESAGE
jgi:nucleobase:cation symporter-1, NCS1 family